MLWRLFQMKRDMSKKILTLRTLFSWGISDVHTYFCPCQFINYFSGISYKMYPNYLANLLLMPPAHCHPILCLPSKTLERQDRKVFHKPGFLFQSQLASVLTSTHLPPSHHICSCEGSKYFYSTFDFSGNFKKKQHITTSSFSKYYSETLFFHPKSASSSSGSSSQTPLSQAKKLVVCKVTPSFLNPY